MQKNIQCQKLLIFKKYEWAKNVCHYLEEHFDSETIMKVRKDYRCNDEKSIADNKILFGYPQCYCACVKRVTEKMSVFWCYCTLGNEEGVFREVFKKEIKATLLDSVKTSGHRCVIEIEW